MKLMDVLASCRECHHEVTLRQYDVDALKPARCPAGHVVHPEAQAATDAPEA